MIRIYSNKRTNTFFIESVAAGGISEFAAERSGEMFSVWRQGLDIYEIKNAHYSNFADYAGNLFASADEFENYLRESLTATPNGCVHEFFNSSLIEFDHNLQKYPAVRIEDSAGNFWISSKVLFPTINSIRVEMSVSFSGRIILS